MIQVLINNVDLSSQIIWDGFEVNQAITSQVDTASFEYRKFGSRTYVPAVNDEVEIFEGVNKIFGGFIVSIEERNLNNADGLVYMIQSSDYGSQLGQILAAKSYVNQTIEQIIDDLISTYAPDFTTTNVFSNFSIGRIAFNEVYISDCIAKLAEIVKYDWYVDEEKDIHFFPKMTNAAPFGLTDTSGNYVNETLVRNIDGTQIVNQVKVRGGESDGEEYTGVITVKGNDTKIFTLPYKFSELVVRVDTGAGYVAKTVGQDFRDDFTTHDCLQNFQEKSIKFENNLADGDKVEYTGKPKVPIKCIVKNSGSVAQYGLKEKIINDSSIIDMTTARKRAKAELLAYQYGSNEISFDSYTSGLRAGMVINLSSTRRDASDNYVINRISFRALGPDDFYYSVNAITTNKLQLVELLQKLMNQAGGNIEDSGVAETIYTDLLDIEVAELIRKVAPYLDHVDIESAETIHKDPLGAGVEPIWVLGPYAPTSASDPKRVGLLDNSLKLY